MSTVAIIHRRGTRATQPLANSVGIGTLYFVTDENIVERSDGTSWQSYSGPASVGGSNTIIQQIIREETFIEEAIRIPGRDGVGGSGGSSVVVQAKNFQTSAVATGSTVIPFDDTIPQNTEGDEYMSLAITPISATNILKIVTSIFLSSLNANWLTAALFQDATANALAVASHHMPTATAGIMLTFSHWMIAGTTSPTTFKIRGGRDASSGSVVTFNGTSSARKFGGVMASSITITEIVP